MTRMCDLPPRLVGMIFAKIPITSVRTVRSTCKLWNDLSKDWVLGKAAAPKQQFLGFMTLDSKLCSIRFNLCRKDKEDEDLLDLSIKQVNLLNYGERSKVFYCDGLLLVVDKDNSILQVCNPYLGQTRWIMPTSSLLKGDMYALGYDNNNRDHKILKILYNYRDLSRYEIYDFYSDSWRVLDVPLDWNIVYNQCGPSLKGNTYFFAGDELDVEGLGFLLCFDFTRERFGPHLPLPFHSYDSENVTLSCVRDEQLAVLYQPWVSTETLEIWFTTKIEPNSVSWSKFLKVNMRPLTGFQFHSKYESFFIDEEKKVAAVFYVDGDEATVTCRYHRAFIIGDDGYFKSVSLGKALNYWGGLRCFTYRYITRPPLVLCSSSYLPSLVQLN